MGPAPTISGDIEVAQDGAVRQHVTLRIEQVDEVVVFSVVDDGFDGGDLADPGHLGLATMRARAEAEGGRLLVHGTPDAGTTVELTLPVLPPPMVTSAATDRADVRSRWS